MRHKTRGCKRCGREWTFPDVPSPHRDEVIEYVCAVCYEAEIASLKRLLAAFRGERDE